MISLREITTGAIFAECLDLSVNESQKDMVDTTVMSLALAWLNRDTARPFAVYDDDTMVGFVMLNIIGTIGRPSRETEGKEPYCEIWQFLIDKKYQGKGYGKAALSEIIKYIQEVLGYQELVICLFPENKSAQKLYESFGFQLTGETEGDEVIMRLRK